jgi:protein-tyrosine phosphatase
LIDIHTHILPGIDDGARNINESLEILRELINQGVTEVIATPHIITGVYNNTKKIIDKKIEKLKSEIIANKLPIKLYKGAELYYEPNIIEKTKQEELNLAGSKYILIESDLQRFPDNFEETLYQFQVAGYVPILAHAERFTPFLNDFNHLIDIANRGILVQINSGSFFGDYGENVQKLAHKILQTGCVHFIASDVHGPKKRPIMLKEVYQFLSENYTEDLAKLLLEENPRRVIRNKPVESMVEGYFEEQPKRTFLGKIRNLFRT